MTSILETLEAQEAAPKWLALQNPPENSLVEYAGAFDSYDLPGTICLALSTRSSFIPTLRLTPLQSKKLREELKFAERQIQDRPL